MSFQKFELHENTCRCANAWLPKADTDSAAAIPLVTEGRDLMGLAQTGQENRGL